MVGVGTCRVYLQVPFSKKVSARVECPFIGRSIPSTTQVGSKEVLDT